MEQRKYGNGSVYRRQDGRWVAAVCSKDPATGKSVRTYFYAQTKREALQRKMDFLAKVRDFPVPSGLTASHS